MQRRDFFQGTAVAAAATVTGCAAPAMQQRTPFSVASTTIPVVGSDQVFPVRRIYCIGRNYAAHAIERGSDPTREPPFFFQKPTDAIQNVALGTVPDDSKDCVLTGCQPRLKLVWAPGASSSGSFYTAAEPTEAAMQQPIQLFDPASSTYTYLVFDETTREALIIDPVDEQVERDLSVLREHGLKLLWSLETHAHADHITSAGAAGGARGRAHGRAGGLQHRHCRRAAQQRAGAALRQRADQSAAHARSHGRQHELSVAQPCLHRRRLADRRLRPHRFPIRQRRRSLSQSHRGAVRVAGGHDRVAGSRLQGAQPFHDRRRKEKQFAGGRQDAWRNSKPPCANSICPNPSASKKPCRPTSTPGCGTTPEPESPPSRAWIRAMPAMCRRSSPTSGGRRGDAVLVDVRSDAEREWVGFVPGAVPLAWKQWPGMAMNPDFDAGLASCRASRARRRC